MLEARREWVKGGEAVTPMEVYTPPDPHLPHLHLHQDVLPGESEELLVGRNQEGNHGTVAWAIGHTGLQVTKV